jgi:hypothetical protein
MQISMALLYCPVDPLGLLDRFILEDLARNAVKNVDPVWTMTVRPIEFFNLLVQLDLEEHDSYC